ncbi:MAG: ATP-binding protein [Paludibacteraceae bacterium]
MRRIEYILLCCLVAVCLAGCHSQKRDAKRLQETLLEQESRAEEQAEVLARYLTGEPDIDSLQTMIQEENSLMYYIFDPRRIVYWSDNWITSDEILLQRYDQWDYYRFHNAHAVGRWTRAGMYNVLILIPIKYAYMVDSPQFRNSYREPFDCSNKWDISRQRTDDGIPIHSSDGRFLFSLVPAREISEIEDSAGNVAEQSFSFQDLFEDGDDMSAMRANSMRVRAYYLISVLLIILILIWGIVGLVRYRGFSNMRLRTRFMYVIMACVLACFVYVFTLSIRYLRINYEQRQQEELQTQCHFIQIYLQNLYYWDMTLSPANQSGLNIDLRDLSYSIGLDILVYDNYGQLVGSSTPGLFSNGILSTRIAPKPFFSEEHTMVQYERIGDIRYLCAYTPFYNGSMVQIGYIAVPFFVSGLELMRETDAFLARLLPPYLLVVILALLASYWAARNMTSSIALIAQKMRHFRIGSSDNHIDYSSHDEVGALVEQYNALVDQVEDSAERLAKAEREGAWRTMARQIAHEINNPLTPMKLTIQQLQRLHIKNQENVPDSPEKEKYNAYFAKATAMLIEQIDNLSHIAMSFSTFAKQPEVVTAEVDVAQKLSNVITLQRNNDQGVPIRYVGPDHGVLVWADSEQIAQVFTNIIRNALQALEGQTEADIIVVMTVEGDYIVVKISDNGPGIPEEVQDRVFRPNFTTKNTGMGLGLAISKNIVEGSGGKICYQTSKKGTTFLVYLKKKQ